MKNIDRLSEWTGSNVCIVWNLTRDTTIGKLIFRFYISRNIREKIPFIITMWIELWQKKKRKKNQIVEEGKFRQINDDFFIANLC